MPTRSSHRKGLADRHTFKNQEILSNRQSPPADQRKVKWSSQTVRVDSLQEFPADS